VSALRPYGDEPSADPWRVQSWSALLSDLLPGEPPGGRPTIIAIDGHSGSGKSTAAGRLASCHPRSVVVHTDDVAWWESFFDWDELMRTGVLEPLHAGSDVRFRPPAWDARHRDGSITVPSGTTLVLVEGVGASRTTLAPWLDASVWVQSDYDEANRRGIARDVAHGQGPDFWWEWMAAENPFLLADRPWERATAIVCGTPDHVGLPHDPASEVLRGEVPHLRG